MVFFLMGYALLKVVAAGVVKGRGFKAGTVDGSFPAFLIDRDSAPDPFIVFSADPSSTIEKYIYARRSLSHCWLKLRSIEAEDMESDSQTPCPYPHLCLEQGKFCHDEWPIGND